MGLMDLDEFRQEVYLLLGQRSEVDPSTITGKARLDRWINNALRWCTQPKIYRHRVLELDHDIVLSIDQPDDKYPLPDDIEFIEFVRNTDTGRRMRPEQPREFLDRSGGNNERYARRGDFIFIRGSAGNDGQTVRVYYYARPEQLTQDDQTTDINEWWDQVIIQNAGFYGWSLFGNFAAADFYRSTSALLANEAAETLQFEAEDAGWMNQIEQS